MVESFAIVQEIRDGKVVLRVYSSHRRWLPNATYANIEEAYARIREERMTQSNETRPGYRWPERECTHEGRVESREQSESGDIVGVEVHCPDCGWDG